MRILLALALIAWTGSYARGMARRVLPHELRDPLGVSIVAFAAGLGVATLVASWIVIAWPGGPAFPVAIAVTALVFVAGVRRTRSAEGDTARRETRPAGPGVGRDWVGRALMLAVVVAALAVLFNAASWPFDEGDALALYAPFGRHVYLTREFPLGDRLYESYPMLVPVAFALTHWAAGGVNEYVARLVPALMALGAIGAAGLIGRSMAGPRAGLTAAALVAATPIFGRWATTGYTDVPASLYAALTVLFAWHWWTANDRRALAAAGAAAGLALWTKNSAVLLLPSLAWLIVWRALAHVDGRARRPADALRDSAAAAAPVLVGAGAWYLRNWIVFGVLIPPTAYVDRAQHSLSTLGVMLRPDQHFGISGWIFTAAVAYGLSMLRSGRPGAADGWHVLLAFVLPFLAAWWWLASYDARFLMVIVPALGAMGALMLLDAAAMIRRAPPTLQRAAWAAATIAVLAATAMAARKTIEHKAALAMNPFPGDVERHRIRLGSLYDLAMAINALPPGARVGGVPRIIGYHLAPDRLPHVAWAPLGATVDPQRGEYDYLVRRADAAMPAMAALVADVGAYRLYRLFRLDATDRR
jgi:hypothetical protein